MTEIAYEVREKDLIAFNEHLLDNSERIQRVFRRHQAYVPGFIAVVALILFFYFKDIPSTIYALILAVVWGGGVPQFLKWSMRKQLRKMYSETEKANILGRYTLKAEPKGLVEIDTKGETNTLDWGKVLRIEVEKKYIFVFVSLNSALIIPRDTIAKECNLHEFVKTVDERIEKAS
jgi:hypothetical protein